MAAAARGQLKTKIQNLIDENPVVVFSKSWCSYSRAAKQLLSDRKAKMYVWELDYENDEDEIQDALQEMTGQRTVPNIFIGQKHIGGNSDLQRRKGDLDKLLSAAGAI